MTLTALQKFEQNKARTILAAAALSQDRLAEPESISKYSVEVAEVLAEIRAALNLSPNDESINARRKIDLALADEIKRVILGQTSIDDVQGKLGTRGELPIGAYKVEFPPGYDEKIHDKKSIVEKAIRLADEVEHLQDEAARLSDRGHTLILKWFEAKGRGVSHWMLIDALRFGNTLSVAAAWRVIPNLVDLKGITSPLDMLLRFLDRYGFEVELPDGTSGRFLRGVNAPVHISYDDLSRNRSIKAGDRYYQYYETGAGLAVGDEAFFGTRILAGYAVDVGLYKKDRLAVGI